MMEPARARANATSALRKRTRPHGRRIGRSTRLVCERVHRKDTSVPKMRAGSHGRNVRESKRSECERARTNASFQNAGGHARTPPWKIDAPRMRVHPQTPPRPEEASGMERQHTRVDIPKTRPATRPPGIHASCSQGCLEQVIQFFIQFFYAAKVNEKKIGWKIG